MADGASRPNVLFLMDDQHRHDFLGCAGAPFLRTPNLDRLAAQGVRFTHCCTNSPVCVPPQRKETHVASCDHDERATTSPRYSLR